MFDTYIAAIGVWYYYARSKIIILLSTIFQQARTRGYQQKSISNDPKTGKKK